MIYCKDISQHLEQMLSFLKLVRNFIAKVMHHMPLLLNRQYGTRLIILICTKDCYKMNSAINSIWLRLGMYDVLWLMFSVLTKNAIVENSGIFLKIESLTTKQFSVIQKSSKNFCILFFAEVRNIFVV